MGLNRGRYVERTRRAGGQLIKATPNTSSIMTNTVFCQKHKKTLEALDRAPFPGPKGQQILETISKQAWAEWQDHQTRLINEKHLNLMDPATRKYLQTEMDKFFAGEDYDKAEGYIPTSN